MAFKGVPIGISDGLAEGEDFFLGLAHVAGYPGLEPAAGAVQELLLPGDRNYLNAPAGLAELLPKPAVGLPPGVQLTTGSHARIYVGEDGPVTLNGDGHLDVEISDASVGAAGVDAFRE